MSLIAINPADGTELARYDELDPTDIEAALARAQAAFEDWRARPVAERAAPARCARARWSTPSCVGGFDAGEAGKSVSVHAVPAAPEPVAVRQGAAE